MITISLNIEFLALVLMLLFVVYLLGLIYANTYVNFTAKDLGRLLVIVYMLGILTVAYLVGSELFIYASLIIMIIFIIWSIVKRKGGNSKSNRVASQQGGN